MSANQEFPCSKAESCEYNDVEVDVLEHLGEIILEMKISKTR